MSRALTLAVLSTLPVGLLAVPANADTLLNTTITGFTSSVSTVDYKQPVTFEGDLLEYTGNVQSPAAGETVQVQFEPTGQASYETVASGTTGSDGHFAISTVLPSGGRARAVYAGSASLHSSGSSGWTELQADHVPSRFVLDQVPASVSTGTQVTFSGQLQVQVDGVWQPFEGYEPITVGTVEYATDALHGGHVTQTDADGRFSVTAPVSGTAYWKVATGAVGSSAAELIPETASVAYPQISGVAKTRITGFTFPARDEIHHAEYSGTYYASGSAQFWDGAAWQPLSYGWVELYYRPKGTTTWLGDSGVDTDAAGHFKIVARAHLGVTEWQVRVKPTSDKLTSTSANTVTSTITDQTHFASIGITRHAKSSTIDGRVTDWYSKQASYSTLRGLHLRIYYRRKGSSTWHFVKIITVGTAGFFRTSVSKSHGYYFKVVLTAQGPYQASTSRTL